MGFVVGSGAPSLEHKEPEGALSGAERAHEAATLESEYEELEAAFGREHQAFLQRGVRNIVEKWPVKLATGGWGYLPVRQAAGPAPGTRPVRLSREQTEELLTGTLPGSLGPPAPPQGLGNSS